MRAFPRPSAIRAAILAALTVTASLAAPARARVLSEHNARRTSSAPIVAAAGDIACDPNSGLFRGGRGTGDHCRALATSRLLRNMPLTAVLTLGDNQYDDGRLQKYRKSYRRSWGSLRSITYPVPGNHDYYSSPRATGYFRYFGDRAGARATGYYSVDVGTWHLIALDSECDYVACRRGSRQYDWLKADLQASTAACTLAFWHEPLFSSGPHGSQPSVRPFWRLLYKYGADVVLNGHDHIYERFAPQTPIGAKDAANGIQEFVVGTGGAERYWVENRQAHSRVRDADSFGVLRLSLADGSYSWRFVPALDARFHDSGEMNCHD
jgi:hypothetical protein